MSFVRKFVLPAVAALLLATTSPAAAADWTVSPGGKAADSYDPVTDTVAGTIQNVAFDWDWPGCHATFAGSLNYRYHNSSGQLEILRDPTLNDIFVDPDNNCLGIVDGTGTASIQNTSTMVPAQQVVPS